jgi:predicted Zn-dependent peptidase
VLGVFILALAWLVPAAAIAQDRVVPDMPKRPRVPVYDPGQPVQRKVLKNGVRLLVQEQRTSERVAGVVGLKMGPLYETEDESGLSQVLMRLVTVGTKGFTPSELQVKLIASRTMLQASSGPDMGQISVSTDREGVDKAIGIMAEVVVNPSFPDSSFETARSTILAKASDEVSAPLSATYVSFLRTLYQGSPYARPPLGGVRALAECRRSDIVALHRKFFVGGNITVAVVGNFDGTKVMAQLEKAFATVPPGPAPTAVGAEPAALTSDSMVVEARQIPLHALVYGFPAPGYDDPDYPAFMILDSYLRSGDRSPISYWLPERRLATGVGVIYPLYPKRSSLAVYFQSAGNTIGAARDTTTAVFQRLAEVPLDDGEWPVQLRRVQNAFFNDQNNPLVRARDLTRYETRDLGLDYPVRFETKLLKLTPEDVRATAERWFKGGCLATSYAAPQKAGP